ncbi:SpoIIE family protein phosphatase [Mycobacterium sp. IDR2000157661]|uniref:SpoIIE family protein phosphatase n=1 Tax=Mycobacterium sp. IDR2000157661 TaxID=2867005 RepID=UPI001EEB9A07|nr:SpoIIE family protein phosphatase [Mycobacterium sp. IDR2000157661]ULE31861.1 SpoIIE family protein phosphatase [Mycobacterium sp. IDR2000157661]
MAGDGAASSLSRLRLSTSELVLVVGSLLAVLLVDWLSLATRPTAYLQSAWWPAAGIALGLGIRFPRRYLWVLAPAVAVTTLPAQLWADRPLALAIALSVAVGIEMVIGTVILRGRADELPGLVTLEDLGRFLVAAFASAVAFDVLATVAELAVSGSAEAWTRLVSAAPKHAAGMLLVTPLFMALRKRTPLAGRFETLLQVTITLAVTAFVFLINDILPVSFLLFVPLVWAATRLTTRHLLIQLLVVSAIGSYGSARGTGIFAFDRLGPEAGSVILQVFELTMVTVLVSLSLMVGLERDTAEQLNISEELFRTNFDSSVAGQLMVRHNGTAWQIQMCNASAAQILPSLRDGVTTLDELLGSSAADVLTATTDGLAAANTRLMLTTGGGRTLDVSVAAVADRDGHPVYALHFQDVTEALRVRRLEQADLDRAGEVQRALLPGRLPSTPGWNIGAVSAPAKQVGGDFYDIRLSLPHAVISLGDVMGKGMGAGMLAAATRAALRSNAPETSPSTAVAHAAGVIDSDLHRSSAFVTLTYVLVNLVSGEFRFADAGHGLHFILRGNGGVERFASEDLPMGLESTWHERRGTLHPGDGILLVSDGLMDLWGGSVDDLERAIVECLRSPDCRGAQTVIEALCAGADTSLDRDDVTAVALRRDSDEII